MEPRNFEALVLLPFILSFLLLQQSRADVSPAAPADPGTICNTTRYPDLCKSVLPPGRSGNVYDYGRFSVARSLSQARKFSRMINKQLARGSSLSQLAVRALEDCQLLSGLNIDFLVSTGEALNASNNLLDPQAERAQTLLSALLTNQQTCLEGLKQASSEWSLMNGLSVPLSNNTKLFSLSLALFSRAWVHGKKKKANFGHGFVRGAEFPMRRGLLFRDAEIGEDGRLPLAMSRRNREIFEWATGRRLLQSPSSNQILVRDVVIVSKGKNRNFTTIGDAVKSAPDNTDVKSGYYLIYVVAGVYEEYVDVPKNKKYLMMVGDGIGRTIITGNRSVVDGWTTFNSATFAVVGQGFVAMNITFRNTAGAAKHQAVAVRNGADQSTFHRCSFEGYQDTLYTHSLRQFYRQCDIYGTVDFIFGNAAVVFQACNMYARLPLTGQKNMVTAQGRTDPNQNTGTSIQGCRILAAPDLAKNASKAKTYLGRPWKLYSRTIVMQSFLDQLIDPAGWLPWDGDFALSTLFYAEFKNTGPGAGTAGRVKWPGLRVINASDALNFTVANFIAGDKWLPSTGVSYLSGLT